MKIVFIGASKYGAQCLRAIWKMSNIEIAGVITNPQQFSISYAKGKMVDNVNYGYLADFCEENAIPYYIMERNMQEAELLENILRWDPSLILVAGWYHMIPEKIRKIPLRGVLGMHASLLPLYRGGAPLVWALINGEEKVGISLFELDAGVDTGRIYAQKEVFVHKDDTIRSLYQKIELAGIELLENYLPCIACDKITPWNQDFSSENSNKVWRQRAPEDGKINWTVSANDLYNFIRAQTYPYPGAFFLLNEEKISVWDSKISNKKNKSFHPPGAVLEINDSGILVKCGVGNILITELSYAGERYDLAKFVALDILHVGHILYE